MKRNERGSAILPMLIFIGIMTGYLAMYYNQMALIQQTQNQRLTILAGVKAQVYSIRSLLMSQRSLIKTLKSPLNGELWQCANDVEFICNHAAPANLSLISEDSDDTNPFLVTPAGTGFTRFFEKCTGFPSIGCPFRYEIKWYTQCSLLNPICASPDIFFEGNLLVADKISSVFVIDPSSYNFKMRVR